MNPSAYGASPEPMIARISNAVSQVPSVGEVREIDIPPRFCGIYFLVDREEIVYIGQSVNVVQRIGVHAANPDKCFDRVFYLACPREMLTHFERHLIMKLRPRYNRQFLETPRAAKEFVVHVLSRSPGGLSFEEICDKARQHGIWAQTLRQLERNLLNALQRNQRIRLNKRDLRYRWNETPDGGRASMGGTEMAACLEKPSTV